MKASLALLCLALACTAYAAEVDVSDLHSKLQAVDPRCVAPRSGFQVEGGFNDTTQAICFRQPQDTLQSHYANVYTMHASLAMTGSAGHGSYCLYR